MGRAVRAEELAMISREMVRDVFVLRGGRGTEDMLWKMIQCAKRLNQGGKIEGDLLGTSFYADLALIACKTAHPSYRDLKAKIRLGTEHSRVLNLYEDAQNKQFTNIYSTLSTMPTNVLAFTLAINKAPSVKLARQVFALYTGRHEHPYPIYAAYIDRIISLVPKNAQLRLSIWWKELQWQGPDTVAMWLRYAGGLRHVQAALEWYPDDGQIKAAVPFALAREALVTLGTVNGWYLKQWDSFDTSVAVPYFPFEHRAPVRDIKTLVKFLKGALSEYTNIIIPCPETVASLVDAPPGDGSVVLLTSATVRAVMLHHPRVYGLAMGMVRSKELECHYIHQREELISKAQCGLVGLRFTHKPHNWQLRGEKTDASRTYSHVKEEAKAALASVLEVGFVVREVISGLEGVELTLLIPERFQKAAEEFDLCEFTGAEGGVLKASMRLLEGSNTRPVPKVLSTEEEIKRAMRSSHVYKDFTRKGPRTHELTQQTIEAQNPADLAEYNPQGSYENHEHEEEEDYGDSWYEPVN
eukprot:TRINITY_DN19295_c0_g1_i1.p1 TRINITY_DN19295_c0_g1~~TRINITY_DN19295_c0_g1_i1.p1  ORF type:complete len:591 (+),score=132.16 TRINITY_DN19295_c0_g1_i1:198-1775(+)